MRTLEEIASARYYNNFKINEVERNANKEMDSLTSQKSITKEIEQVNKAIDEINSQIDQINSSVSEINSVADEINDLISDNEALSDVSSVSNVSEVSAACSISNISDLDISTDEIKTAIEFLSNAASTDLESALKEVFVKIVYGKKEEFEDIINNSKEIAKSFNLNEDDVIAKQKEMFIKKLEETDLELDFTNYISNRFHKDVENFFVCNLDNDVKELILQQIYSSYTSYGLNAPINFQDCKIKFEEMVAVFDEYKTEDGTEQKLTHNIIETLKNDFDLQAFVVNKFPNPENNKVIKAIQEQTLDNLKASPNFALKLLKNCLSSQNIYPTQYTSNGDIVSEYHTEGIYNTLIFFTKNKISFNMEDPEVEKIFSNLAHTKTYIPDSKTNNKKFSINFIKKEVETFKSFQKKLNLDKVMESVMEANTDDSKEDFDDTSHSPSFRI